MSHADVRRAVSTVRIREASGRRRFTAAPEGPAAIAGASGSENLETGVPPKPTERLAPSPISMKPSAATGTITRFP